MTVDQRIRAFHRLGKELETLSEHDFQSLAHAVRNENPWFTPDNVRMAVRSIASWLDEKTLATWTAPYDMARTPRVVAIVMAGNIPLVGFHDLLSVLIAGHHALIKTSAKDTLLVNDIIKRLVAIEPEFAGRITIAEQLKGFDAVIATGSDNTSRYFDYYFGRYQHIIRRNRTSVAVLDGSETTADLYALGCDVFTYFGLGCRNVGKLFIPEGYAPQTILDGWQPFHDIVHHYKYCNNYDYQKSVLLVARKPFLDTGFVLLQENENLVSPLSTVYYETYADSDALAARLLAHEDKIQCVVSAQGDIRFGQSQSPTLSDYADRIDTLQFVTTLN